jgi:putative FmdB family regulatory protein
MPTYDYTCAKCGQTIEVFRHTRDGKPPECCGEVMTRIYTGGFLLKWHHPLWVDRMEDIHKAQEQRGERFRRIHPKEVGATGA